jgi:hypothetical protein
MSYIFDKALLTTHHFVVLKDDVIIPKPCILWRLNFKKQTDMKLQCYGVQPTKNKLTSLRKKGRLISSKSTPKMMERISNCPNNRQEIKNSSLISEMY